VQGASAERTIGSYIAVLSERRNGNGKSPRARQGQKEGIQRVKRSERREEVHFGSGFATDLGITVQKTKKPNHLRQRDNFFGACRPVVLGSGGVPYQRDFDVQR